MYKILIISNDSDILGSVSIILKIRNFKVSTYREVQTPIEIHNFRGFDLILLDCKSSNIDGLEICKQIRNEISSPIIFLGSKEEMCHCLDAGGDDYITKPIVVKEFVAKLVANLKREERHKILESKEKIVREIFPLTFYLQEKIVCINGVKLPLTSREYAILELLSGKPNKVFTRAEIYENVYDEESEALFHSISEYIYQIRQKFSYYGINPIKTVRGIGYKWS